MVGAGAHKRQTQSHVDALLDTQVLDWDQAVVVGHGHHDVELSGVLSGVARAHEHGVGGERPAGIDAFAARRLHRWRNDAHFLIAEQTALARVRVQTGHRDARPHLAPSGCALMGNPNGAEHRIKGHRVDGAAQRQVDGHQHAAQLVVGQHHAHLWRRLAGHGRQRLEHFGVTRKANARSGQRLFVNWRGHNRRDFAVHRQLNGLLDTSHSRRTCARIHLAHRRFHQ